MLRVVWHWPGLVREVGDASSPEPFQIRLFVALSNLLHLQMSLLTAGDSTRWPLKVSFDLNHSVISFSMKFSKGLKGMSACPIGLQIGQLIQTFLYTISHPHQANKAFLSTYAKSAFLPMHWDGRSLQQNDHIRFASSDSFPHGD